MKGSAMAKANRYSKAIFLIILGILFYLSFLIIRPFVTYLILAAVLAVIVNPLYLWLEKGFGHATSQQCSSLSCLL